MSGFTVVQICQLYRIDCIDFERCVGSWLLMGAGTGLMMAVMDQEPRIRYCLDTDVLPREQWARLPDWLQCMEVTCGRVLACGWFSRYENGLPLIGALKALKRPPLVYFGAYERPDLLEHCEVACDVGDFIARIRAISGGTRQRPSAPSRGMGSASAAMFASTK